MGNWIEETNEWIDDKIEEAKDFIDDHLPDIHLDLDIHLELDVNWN